MLRNVYDSNINILFNVGNNYLTVINNLFLKLFE